MAERAAQIRGALEALVDGQGLLGAAVVTRDGEAVVSIFSRSVGGSFAAMGAAALGAAQAALDEWGDPEAAAVSVAGSRLRVDLVGLGLDHFLAVVAAQPDAPALDDAVRRLRGLVG